MKTRTILFLASLAVIALGGCLTQADRSDGAAPAAFAHAEMKGMLALINDRETTSEVLHIDCALPPALSRDLVAQRLGPDGQAGTVDDLPFRTLAELEAVPGMRPWSLDWILGCAQRLGFVPTEEELALLAFVNDLEQTDYRLLNASCRLRSDAAGNLIAHRDGPDGVPNTPDDNLFDDLVELDSVPMVGPTALDRLARCAAALAPAPVG